MNFLSIQLSVTIATIHIVVIHNLKVFEILCKYYYSEIKTIYPYNTPI